MTQLVSELEQLVDVQGVAARIDRGGLRSEFDPLEMDQYNELHTVTHRLVELANDARALDESIDANYAELDNLLIDQGRLHRESQEAVLYRDGKALDVFGPGRHTLSTQNIPLLGEGCIEIRPIAYFEGPAQG